MRWQKHSAQAVGQPGQDRLGGSGAIDDNGLLVQGGHDLFDETFADPRSVLTIAASLRLPALRGPAGPPQRDSSQDFEFGEGLVADVDAAQRVRQGPGGGGHVGIAGVGLRVSRV
jgi:hypothetical protein